MDKSDKTFAMISLGCAKNLVNSEQMLYLMSEAGFTLVPEPEGADLVIVNTCGFIDAAKSEAIDNILEMAELKKAGKLGGIIVTGCLSERYKDTILQELPEIDAVLGISNFKDIVFAANAVLERRSLSLFADQSAPVDEIPRVVTTGPGWAYLRIAEGCNNFCSFCAIPYIRGRYRSRSMENILEEARDLAAHGVKELIVIAQDITRYGTDLYGKRTLAELCRKLSEIEGIEWLRLHYLYVDQFDDELIDEIAGNPKIVKYLDIPIQHINDKILKSMNRRGTGADIRTLFKTLRERVPGLVLRTSLIAGLPGEGEAEFEELCEFLREAHIERVGVFPFSPEEGTPAAQMEHVDFEEAQRRADLILELQAPIMEAFCQSFVGKTIDVLCEGFDEESQNYYGRCYADSPDIDGQVFYEGFGREGEIQRVVIDETEDGLLYGHLEEE
ncbi:MAG: 30S ribosomal protein S12 methylthiotransferase RimO [Oscillospiraceae bacterium]|nr:30S ribosomal protein S12 methylthiotransferase RimO [Oscillospiraceae bacterium]